MSMQLLFIRMLIINEVEINNSFLQLVNSYLTGRDHALDELHVIASRLLLDIMPGLETTVIFQDNVSDDDDDDDGHDEDDGYDDDDGCDVINY